MRAVTVAGRPARSRTGLGVAGAAFALGAVACGSVPMPPTVDFVPEDKLVCPLPADAPAGADEARDRAWEALKAAAAAQKAWRETKASMWKDLELPSAEGKTASEAMAAASTALAEGGCVLHSTNDEGEFPLTSAKCRAGKLTQADGDAALARMRAAWKRAVETSRRVDAAAEAYNTAAKGVTGTELFLCNVTGRYAHGFGGTSRELFDLRMGLVTGVAGSVMNNCPYSPAACLADCKAGDLQACVLAVGAKDLPEDQRLDLRLKICEEASLAPADLVEAARSTCITAVSPDPLKAYPDRIPRALKIAETRCAGGLDDKCMPILGVVLRQDWFRATPTAARIAAGLQDQCATLGVGRCADVAAALFHDGKDSMLAVPLRKRLASDLRAACDAGKAAGCAGLGYKMFAEDASVDVRTKAVVRACELDVAGCWGMAGCFKPDNRCGLQPDPALVKHASERLCDDFRKRAPDAPATAYAPCVDAAR